ncbi:MAG: hypothetical protein L0Z49_10145 [Actinobacteria bacterium]|nr:hypothetical protein [Actinomycetota bacterium]MCI0544787.1 hypothetical protein [Actinomycetota bacterium]MCI0678069.1 hypothetical protein [Actinomycetota bacterium]
MEAAESQRVAQLTVCRSCDSKVPAGMPQCQICGAEIGLTPGPLDNV